jgi:DNA-binding transcriptional MerR regulator
LKFKPHSGDAIMTPTEHESAGPELKIGELAKLTRTSTPTIRYYESIGLIPPAARRRGGQRRYGSEDARRLTFIRRCREFGFSVDQVRMLADLMNDEAKCCTEARDIAQSHLEDVRAKRAELEALEHAIADFVERCDTTCVGGPGPACVPLTELARVDLRRLVV